jgi:TRAP-type C4-dicarboxylate transport system permease small subunit
MRAALGMRTASQARRVPCESPQALKERRMDQRVARIEKALAALCTGALCLCVFLDVAHRFWSRPLAYRALAASLVLAVAVRALGWLRGIAVVTALSAVMEIFVRLVPSGLVFAQTLALILLLWVTCLGASLASRSGEHLVVATSTPRAGAAFAALCCLMLGVASLLSVRAHFVDWKESAGVFIAIPLPKWVAFSILPYAFFTMSVRFARRAT